MSAATPTLQRSFAFLPAWPCLPAILILSQFDSELVFGVDTCPPMTTAPAILRKVLLVAVALYMIVGMSGCRRGAKNTNLSPSAGSESERFVFLRSEEHTSEL